MPLMDHDAFRATALFAEVCRDHRIDPARPLESQHLPLTAALDFWQAYEAARAAASARAPGDIARQVADLIGFAQGEPGTLSLVARYGHLIVVADEAGGVWALPVRRHDDAETAAAMTAAARPELS